MTIFNPDRDNITSEAFFRGPTIGPPTGFAENTSAAFDASMRTMRTVSTAAARDEILEETRDEIVTRTGEDPGTPEFFNFQGGVTGAIPTLLSMVRTQMAPGLDEFFDKARKTNEQFGTELPTNLDEIQQEVARRAAESEEEAARLGQRATFGGNVGQFVGTAGGIFTDPPILATSFAGAPLGASVLRTAMFEAGIIGATEAAIQPIVQQQRADMGLEAGLERALFNIATATAGGAIIGGGLRALGKGTKNLVDRAKRFEDQLPPEGKASLRFLQRTDETLEMSPYIDSRRARKDFIDNFDEAMMAIRRGDDIPTPRRNVVADVRQQIDPADLPPEIRDSQEFQQMGRIMEILRRPFEQQAGEQAREEASQVAARAIFQEPRLEEIVTTLRNRQQLNNIREGFIRSNAKLKDSPTPQQRAAVTRQKNKLESEFKRANPHLVEGDELTAIGREAFHRFLAGKDVLQQTARVFDELGLDVEHMDTSLIRQKARERARPSPPRAEVDTGKAQANEEFDSRSATRAAERDIEEFPDDRQVMIQFPDDDAPRAMTMRQLKQELNEEREAIDQFISCTGL